MFKTLDRYILRAFFTNYVIALAVLIGLYVILDLFVNLDEFTNIQTSSTMQMLSMIADFYGHNMFLYFAQLAGVITLVAGCFTLGRLHRTNELTAVLATGTSLYRVAAPILLAGLAMNTLWLIDQELIIPNIAGKLARKHGDVEGLQTYAIWFLPDPKQNNALVSATGFNPTAQEMRGVIIIERDESNQMTGMIQADRATWDEERRQWHFMNGFRRQLNTSGADTGADDLESVTIYPSNLTPKQLSLQQSAQWTMFLSLPEINELMEYFKERGVGEFIKVKHSRITTVIMNMVLLCLGIPFFLNRERPSVVIQGGKCLLACGLCYVTTFFCNTVDLSVLGLSPALPPWLPILLFTPFAVVLLDGIKT